MNSLSLKSVIHILFDRAHEKPLHKTVAELQEHGLNEETIKDLTTNLQIRAIHHFAELNPEKFGNNFAYDDNSPLGVRFSQPVTL